MASESSADDGRASVGELATVFAGIYGMLLSEQDATAAVEQLALVARDLMTSAVGAGASLLDETGRRVSTGTTDKIVAAADALQYELGEGPCLSAAETASVQRVDDAAAEDRWPAWCAAAQALGIRSEMSAPMMFKGTSIGALKVYATEAHVFGPEDERRLVLLAGVAATLLGIAQGRDAPQRLSGELRRALGDRQAVETATGMLMERHDIDHAAARQRLLAASRARRQPTAVVARHVQARHVQARTDDIKG